MSIQEEIKAYVDGELSPQLAETVGTELEKSSELSQQAAFYRLLSEEIREMAIEPQVIGADEALTAVRRGRRFNYRELAVPFGIAAIVLVIGGVVSGQPSKSDSAGLASTPLSVVSRYVGDETGVHGATGASQAKARFKASRNVAPSGAAIGATRVDGIDNSTVSNGASVTRNVTPYVEPQGYLGPKGGSFGASGELLSPSPKGQIEPASPPSAPPLANTPSQAVTTGSRMVVQNGTIDVAVPDPSRAQSETLSYVRAIGGFAENSSLDRDEDQNPHADLTLRVPIARFSETMDFLKRFAKNPKDVKALHVTGQDVTGQYADTNARLRVMRSEEEDYVQMLKKVRHMDDILTLKDKLSDVRQQIESLEAQASTLRDTSALSTIQATFEQIVAKVVAKPVPVAPQRGWADEAWSNAGEGAKSLGQFVATGAIFALVYAPFWLPLALAGWWFTRRKF